MREGYLQLTVDYWSKSKLLGLLLASPQGERIANHFYGDPTADAMSLHLALRAGGPLESVGDAAARLEAIVEWLDRNDPYFMYPVSARPPEAPEPLPWPGSILTVELVKDGSVQRIDAVPRNPEAVKLYGPAGRAEIEQSPEGQAALEALNRVMAEGGIAEINSGARLVLERVPPMLRSLIGELEGPGRLVVKSRRRWPAPWLARLEAKSDRGHAELEVELRRVPPPPGWEAALEGVEGGLTIVALLRRKAPGGEMSLTWTYRSQEQEPIRKRARVLAFPDVLHGKGVLTIRDSSGAGPDFPISFEPRPVVPAHLEPNRKVAEWLVEISDWLGRDLDFPDEGFTRESYDRLGQLAEIVRRGGSQMTFEQITLQMKLSQWVEPRAAIEAGAPLRVALPLTLPYADLRIGQLVGELTDVKIASETTVLNGAGEEEIEVRLEPAGEAAAQPTFRLEPLTE